MRVTSSSILQFFNDSMQRMRSQQNTLLEQMASGKKVAKPSDDPATESRIAQLRQELATLGHYQDTAIDMDRVLKQYDSSLASVTTSLHAAFQKGSQAATSLYDANGRQILANELRAVRDHLVSLANSTDNGNFLYSGTLTSTQPFSIDTVTDAVVYSGNSNTIQVEVAPAQNITKNLPGDQVFMGPGGVFDSLTNLIHNIEAGNSAGTTAALTTLKAAEDHLSQQVGINGGKMETLDKVKKSLVDRNAQVLESTSDLQDANLAEVITGLSLSDTALQSLYQAAGMVGKNSLFDYIA